MIPDSSIKKNLTLEEYHKAFQKIDVAKLIPRSNSILAEMALLSINQTIYPEKYQDKSNAGQVAIKAGRQVHRYTGGGST